MTTTIRPIERGVDDHDDVNDKSIEFYIIFSNDNGEYLLPTNRRDCDKYASVFATLTSTSNIDAKRRLRPIGTCVNITPDILCIIDRGEGEPESRVKPAILVKMIINTVKEMEKVGRDTTVFLPTLRNNYIVNSKYNGLLLNENVQLVFV